ncbi:transporter of nicotinic acid [Scheffersomyces xylosifermentans]|uniref:transporter of nicotinic acid n=1 Tax=Scheffersomyces xylosifermentans TaxID=1304137 RepID=UPI00315C6291
MKDTKAQEVDIVAKASRSSFESSENPLGLEQITSPSGEKIVLAPDYYDHELELRICRKLDYRILPLTAIMYLFNALDKGNISNAKTDGLDVDIGITGDRWNLMLSIFYIPFVLFGFPLSLVIKKYNAARVIPILMFTFGSITLLIVSVFNFSSLMAARWFLGMCESAFFPGIIYYLTTFYRRGELARRLSIFYSAANIANAFSGLLAYGVFQIEHPHLHGWQILLLIEGFCTLVFACVGFYFLPRSVESAKFFTEEERKYARFRVDTDSSALIGKETSLKDAVKVFKHPVYIVWMFQEIAIGVPLNSINNWFPQIIQSLGKSTVQTNLFTVAPNVSGAVCLLILAFSSDYFKVRSIFVIIAISTTLIGFVVFGAIDTQSHIGVAYFSCFLMTAGSSASSVLTSTWYNNNTPNENRRVVVSSIGVPLANAAGLISTNIFRPQDAPKYIPALGITAGFGGLGIITAGSIVLFMIYDNRRRNKEQGVNLTYRDVSTSELGEGPGNPNFRWMY